MAEKYYELSVENYHDSTQKKQSVAYYPKNTLLDAQVQFSQKMASEINNAECKHILNLVIDSEGKMQDDFKDYFEKYNAEDTKVFRHYLFVLFTYTDGTEDEPFFNSYDNPADATANYYSKRGAGMKKSNIKTVTELIFNSLCEEEKSYFWDKYAPDPDDISNNVSD